MEGVNVGAILLAYLGVLVLGITSLAALGLLIARKTRAALLTFAAGLLGTAVIAALATLSFLQKGQGFPVAGSELMIVVMALSLLLAGIGQFVAAFRRPRTYAIAFCCAAASAAIVVAFPLLGADVVGGLGQSPTGFGGPLAAASLILAVAGLMVAVFFPSDSRQREPERPENRGRA